MSRVFHPPPVRQESMLPCLAHCAALCCLLFALPGCSERTSAPPPTVSSTGPTGTADEPARSGAESPGDGAVVAPPPMTEGELHRRLKAANPDYNGKGQFGIVEGHVVAVSLVGTGVRDLSPLAGLAPRGIELTQNPLRDLRPLAGMELEELYLEQTEVTDLTPLKGMPLRKIYLSNTPIRDLGPLAGMPLEELNLVRTEVTDLAPLAGAPLKMLWLNDTPVTDLGPLAGAPLVSLTAKGTRIADVVPVRLMPKLQRLHIANTPVADLGPLAGLRLTRLVFTPARITAGLDAVRQLPALQQIGTRFGEAAGSDLVPPVQFWEEHDAEKEP